MLGSVFCNSSYNSIFFCHCVTSLGNHRKFFFVELQQSLPKYRMSLYLVQRVMLQCWKNNVVRSVGNWHNSNKIILTYKIAYWKRSCQCKLITTPHSNLSFHLTFFAIHALFGIFLMMYVRLAFPVAMGEKLEKKNSLCKNCVFNIY